MEQRHEQRPRIWKEKKTTLSYMRENGDEESTWLSQMKADGQTVY